MKHGCQTRDAEMDVARVLGDLSDHRCVPEPRLPLKDPASRHRGLTEAIAASCLEAARVCLDRHHVSPIDFQIRNDAGSASARIEWDTPDDRCRGAWANAIDATEPGAYAYVIAAVELVEGTIRRAAGRDGHRGRLLRCACRVGRRS